MYLSVMCYPVIFLPTAFICICFLICQYYVVLLERTNKYIIIVYDRGEFDVHYDLSTFRNTSTLVYVTTWWP